MHPQKWYLFFLPAWIFRRAKSLDLCGLQRAETEQVVSYSSEAQKCLSIVPHSTEKAGKKFLTSYPLSVAACLPAVKLVCFQTFLIGGCLSGPSASIAFVSYGCHLSLFVACCSDLAEQPAPMPCCELQLSRGPGPYSAEAAFQKALCLFQALPPQWPVSHFLFVIVSRV